MEREIKKLTVLNNYINEAIEAEICNLIPFKKQKGVSRNQILRYGIRHPYHDGYQGMEIPKIFDQFRESIEFNSVTINSYYEGQLIPYHIDDLRAGKKINVLSLLSDATMKFRLNQEVVEFLLPRFSLTIMEDEIRNQWEHSVKAEKNRVSVVFRNCR